MVRTTPRLFSGSTSNCPARPAVSDFTTGAVPPNCTEGQSPPPASRRPCSWPRFAASRGHQTRPDCRPFDPLPTSCLSSRSCSRTRCWMDIRTTCAPKCDYSLTVALGPPQTADRRPFKKRRFLAIGNTIRIEARVQRRPPRLHESAELAQAGDFRQGLPENQEVDQI